MKLLPVLLLLALTSWSQAGEQRALEHTVITLTPVELAQLEGAPIAELSVMAWRGESFVAVPFQIDEMDRLDLVWFEENDFELRGKKGLFDGADQLLLMLRDAGAQAPD